jgi:hypothetical protein
MILTKDSQEKMVANYLMTHSVEQTEGFIDGIQAIVSLINKFNDEI